MPQLGKTLIVVGLGIALLGVIFSLGGGRLPGDFTWRGKNTTVYFPVMTCVVVSVVGSLLLWLIQRR